MPKGDVVKRHGESRAMREMGDNEGVGDTTMFMDDDEVCYALSITCGDEVFDDSVTSVETVGVGENESKFLRHF